MPGHGEVVGPVPEGSDPEEYDRLRRRVLWQLPMGLYLLGTFAGEERNLMTLNWAMQVAMRPKLVAVAVENEAVSHRLLVEGECFALSIIAREEKAVVRKFVKPALHDPAARTLNGIGYETAITGAPYLASAHSFLDCALRHTLEIGSHTLFVGEVVSAGGGEDADVLRMEDTRMSYGG